MKKIITTLIVVFILLGINSYGAEVDKLYTDATSTLQKGNFTEALVKLRELSSNFPNHSLAGNFHYWSGIALSKLEKYDEASIEFSLASAKKFSNKIAESIFELGKCYAKIGKSELAKREWQKFVELYPENQLIESVKARLKN